MTKRKKPYVLIAVVVVLLSIVGYVNLRNAFANAEAQDQGPQDEAPVAQAPSSNQKEQMAEAMQKTMGAPGKTPAIPGRDAHGVQQEPLVRNPIQQSPKPVPSDSQTGRLSDSPNARK